MFANIKLPITYLITQGNLTSENFHKKKHKTLNILNKAVEAGISLIQIREKKLSSKLVYELTTEALTVSNGSKTKILVNDRFDIALAAKAHGVHLTSTSIPTNQVRKNTSSEFVIGVSTHSLEKANKAKVESADFATFSPVYYTKSKAKYGEPQGVEKLSEVCKKLAPFPIIALGGINKNNYLEILKKGASGFASISFLNNLENLRKLDI